MEADPGQDNKVATKHMCGTGENFPTAACSSVKVVVVSVKHMMM